MIHSCAGGELYNQQIVNLAKVKINGKDETFWYLNNVKNVEVGDVVLVPFGIIDELHRATVLELLNNVNTQISPIKIKNAKQIVKKL